MVEANEDITLVAERQVHDVEEGLAQAKAIAEGREIHPAELAARLEIENPQPVPVQAQVAVPPKNVPPPDPDAAMRHLRLSVVAVIARVLFLAWIRQKRSVR